MDFRFIFFGLIFFTTGYPAISAVAENPEKLTLEEAISITLSGHPALQAAALRVDAADLHVQQARTRPNPSLEAEVENIGGSGDLSGTDGAEITLVLSQPITLGGKRRAQKQQAEAERNLSEREAEILRETLMMSLKEGFFSTLANQERLTLLESNVADMDALAESSKRRVASGAGSQLELARAEIEVAQATSDRELMKIQRMQSRRQVALILGHQESEMPLLSGSFYEVEPPPALDVLLPKLASNPGWKKWADERSFQTAVVEAAMGEAIPDVDLGLGWRRDEAEGAESFLFSVGIPLPLFDRNQNVRKAEERNLSALDLDQSAAKRELESSLIRVWSQLKQAEIQVNSLQNSVLPAADRAWQEAREGWIKGRFGYLDLVAARNVLMESRLQQIDALEQAHHAKAQLEWLLAEPLTP